jgi:hypothetical protein
LKRGGGEGEGEGGWELEAERLMVREGGFWKIEWVLI